MSDDIVSVIKETTDYSLFKELRGNRKIDKRHVKRLLDNMIAVGNLTGEFPIIVNEHYEVVDGQHRLAALKEMNWPVYYRIQPHLGLSTVRGINQAQQNWSWRDYASSYAELDNIEYRKFLNLANDFDGRFKVLCMFAGITDKGNAYKSRLFRSGDIAIPDYDYTVQMFKQQQEVSEILGDNSNYFAFAMYRIMRSPAYDHKRMVAKAKQHPEGIKQQINTLEYMRALEAIYNYHVQEENRVRLFV